MMFIKDLMCQNRLLALLPLLIPFWLFTELTEIGYYLVYNLPEDKPSFENSFIFLYNRY